ncbi:hypothetical protein MKZ38_005258 [Zalerion maritima]|uniref:Uncharacterized protein n=1 Tax=Zalerion maritima TaxID=339359 RepID=A0AAD5RKG9_9PEZI|nr:hypothetical protein MKZ38_005258 [Zalerion maritima]
MVTTVKTKWHEENYSGQAQRNWGGVLPGRGWAGRSAAASCLLLFQFGSAARASVPGQLLHTGRKTDLTPPSSSMQRSS